MSPWVRWVLSSSALLAIVSGSGCENGHTILVEVYSEPVDQSAISLNVEVVPTRGTIETKVVNIPAQSLQQSPPWLLGTIAVRSTDPSASAQIRVAMAVGKSVAECNQPTSGCFTGAERITFDDNGVKAPPSLLVRSICKGAVCPIGSRCDEFGTCQYFEPSPPASPDDAYAKLVLQDRPRHYFQLDEAEGQTVYDRITPATGQLDPSVGLRTTGALVGIARTAVQLSTFAGPVRSIRFPRLTFLSKDFSIEVWVRPSREKSEEYSPIFEQGDFVSGMRVGLDRQAPFIYINREGVGLDRPTTNVYLPTDRFSHLVFTAGAGTAIMYANGDEVRRYTYNDNSAVKSAPRESTIGSEDGVLDAAIDELAIYDYALPRATVAAHHAAGRSLPARSGASK